MAGTGQRADGAHMIWPVAALAVLLLGFVIGYGSALQARLESTFSAPAEPSEEREPEPSSYL
jgi:hypothetical protein